MKHIHIEIQDVLTYAKNTHKICKNEMYELCCDRINRRIH